MRIKLHTLLILAGWALMMPGCIAHHHHSGGHETAGVEPGHSGGPPPHAPAHGHRRKHGHPSEAEVAIEFDSALGVYVVIEHPDCYWDGKRYLRWTGYRWEASVDFDGRWTVVASNSDVPPGLRKKHAHAKKHKHRPAKHGY